jgi:hypothetical protein
LRRVVEVGFYLMVRFRARRRLLPCPRLVPSLSDEGGELKMAKKSRGGRMTAAKNRAAKTAGGKGPVKTRKVGEKIMKT